MLIVTGSVTGSADTFDQLRDACLAHTHRSRTEPGCISHAVHVDCENPLRLFFYEQWSDIAALQAHFAVPGTLEFVGTLRRLAVASERATVYQAEKLPIPT